MRFDAKNADLFIIETTCWTALSVASLDSFDYFGYAQYEYAPFDKLRTGKTGALGTGCAGMTKSDTYFLKTELNKVSAAIFWPMGVQCWSYV